MGYQLHFPFLLLFFAPFLQGQSTPRKMIASMDGKELYQAYCASCHGAEAKGNGPVASALKRPPPDLTTLTKCHGGKFPGADLEKVILGDKISGAAHGSSDMPVWGPVFRQIENDMDLGLMRVHQVVEYLKKLQ